VLGHHVLDHIVVVAAGQHHIGALCVAALRVLLTPVHAAAHGILLIGLGVALTYRVRAMLRARRTVAVLSRRAATPADPVWHAAERAGVDPHRVVVVDGLANPAFTAGWWRPRVYVSSLLAQRLSLPELTAVLAHERVHVARRDPLRLSVTRFLADVFFWLPVLRRLASDLRDEAEFRADEIAAGEQPLVLASAMLRVARWHAAPMPVGSVGFAPRGDLLEHRVRRLAGERLPRRTHVTRWSVTGALVALAIVWSAGIIVPQSPEHGSSHAGMAAMTDPCARRPGFALLHLICPERHHVAHCAH
jgi:beta-lactamase regulating signal transducer with metallopeptidase domain